MLKASMRTKAQANSVCLVSIDFRMKGKLLIVTLPGAPEGHYVAIIPHHELHAKTQGQLAGGTRWDPRCAQARRRGMAMHQRVSIERHD
jgi:hypothetical protein